MSSGREKVDATVNSAVRYSPLAVNMQLLSEVLLILFVNVFHDWLPAKERVSREESGSHWIILVMFLR